MISKVDSLKGATTPGYKKPIIKGFSYSCRFLFHCICLFWFLNENKYVYLTLHYLNRKHLTNFAYADVSKYYQLSITIADSFNTVKQRVNFHFTPSERSPLKKHRGLRTPRAET